MGKTAGNERRDEDEERRVVYLGGRQENRGNVHCPTSD